MRSIATVQALVLEDRQRGRATLLEALAATTATDDRESQSYVLCELGSIDAVTGNLSSAMERLEAAMKIAWASRSPSRSTRCSPTAALCYGVLARVETAVAIRSI